MSCMNFLDKLIIEYIFHLFVLNNVIHKDDEYQEEEVMNKP